MTKPGTPPAGARGGSPAPAGSSGNEKERIRRIVVEGDYAALVEEAERIGHELAQNLNTSQIRNVFGEVRRLQMRFDPNRLRMLKPKLAYMGARAGPGGRRLQDVLTAAVDAIFSGNPDQTEVESRFKRTVDFFEAILAYHKFFGGRDR